MRPLATLFLCLLGAAAAAERTPRGLEAANLTLGPPTFWNTGSLLVRVRVANPTPAAQRVEVRYGSPSGDPSQGLQSASAVLDLPPGATAIAEIPLPQANHPGRDTVFVIDESRKETAVGDVPTFRSWDNNELALYLSRSLSGDVLRDQIKTHASDLGKEKELRQVTGREITDVSTRAAREGDFADPWPGDWRAYSTFDGVFLSPRDADGLPPAAAAALRDYAAAGGAVFLCGAEELPAAFRDAPFTGLFEGVHAAARRCGLGIIAALPGTFGAPGAGPGDVSRTDVQFLLRCLFSAKKSLSEPGAPAAALAGGPTLPTRLGTPPVGTFLVLLGAFALLAGPGLTFALARMNRRIHVLWILPAVSALFSTAILATLFLRDGVSPRWERRAAVLLDQESGRALCLSDLCVCAPLTLPSLDLPTDAVVDLPRDPWRARHGSVRVSRAARYEGWFSPRNPREFGLARATATPLRLDIRPDAGDGPPRVLNALGSSVRTLWLVDGKGAVWEARDVAPGAEASFAPLPGGVEALADPARASGPFAAACAALRRTLGATGLPHPGAGASPAAPRRRAFYIARLDDDPFEPPILADRRSRGETALCLVGLFQPPAAP